MSSSARRVVWAAIVLTVAASSLDAQSLADVARQEEARRKAVAGSGKVYTNDNVRAEPRPAPEPAPAATPSANAGDTAKSDGATSDAAKSATATAAATTEKRDEDYWRKRLGAARDTLSRAQMFAEALQSRINGLTADFTARDDPAQRSAVAQDRDKALAELDRVRKEIQDTNKAIEAIQDEGRRAGAPAGWLR
jgi:hypothetical protein